MGTKQFSRRKFIRQSSYGLTALMVPFPLLTFSKYTPMADNNSYEIIIIGGSYSGLSAAMALGRSLRKVLILDSGKPCNIQTPHSHNLITHDGQTPAEITAYAKEQVLQYETIKFHNGLAIAGKKTDSGFEIKTANNEMFTAKKLIFATGIKDIMPDIEGFAECWGISILHCPYCHGYEVKNERTAVMLNGDMGFEVIKLINNWTKDLVLFTNGASTLTPEQTAKIRKHKIEIIETEIDHIEHVDGQVNYIVLKDKSRIAVKAIYARPVLTQHSDIPEALGCSLTENGLISVDILQKTNVPGVYACGDNSSFGRALSVAIAAGSMAGAAVNKELIEEEF
jgi:thioredoxin reductase